MWLKGIQLAKAILPPVPPLRYLPAPLPEDHIMFVVAMLFYVAVGIGIVCLFADWISGSSKPSGSTSSSATEQGKQSSNSQAGSSLSPPILIGGAVVGIAIFLALAWFGGQRHGNDLFPKAGPSAPYRSPADTDRIYRSQFRSERERLDFEAQIRREDALKDFNRDAPVGGGHPLDNP
jgi:hypothetical protein